MSLSGRGCDQRRRLRRDRAESRPQRRHLGCHRLLRWRRTGTYWHRCRFGRAVCPAEPQATDGILLALCASPARSRARLPALRPEFRAFIPSLSSSAYGLCGPASDQRIERQLQFVCQVVNRQAIPEQATLITRMSLPGCQAGRRRRLLVRLESLRSDVDGTVGRSVARAEDCREEVRRPGNGIVACQHEHVRIPADQCRTLFDRQREQIVVVAISRSDYPRHRVLPKLGASQRVASRECGGRDEPWLRRARQRSALIRRPV